MKELPIHRELLISARNYPQRIWSIRILQQTASAKSVPISELNTAAAEIEIISERAAERIQARFNNCSITEMAQHFGIVIELSKDESIEHYAKLGMFTEPNIITLYTATIELLNQNLTHFFTGEEFNLYDVVLAHEMYHALEHLEIATGPDKMVVHACDGIIRKRVLPKQAIEEISAFAFAKAICHSKLESGFIHLMLLDSISKEASEKEIELISQVMKQLEGKDEQ